MSPRGGGTSLPGSSSAARAERDAAGRAGCDRIVFLQRSADIVNEAGGQIDSASFAAAYNSKFNSSAEMTKEVPGPP